MLVGVRLTGVFMFYSCNICIPVMWRLPRKFEMFVATSTKTLKNTSGNVNEKEISFRAMCGLRKEDES
jgi:hypothetical protein